MTELSARTSGMNSRPATFMRKKNAAIVLPNFIAVAAVLRIPIISMAGSMTPMILAVNCKKKRIECAIMIKAALAEEEE